MKPTCNKRKRMLQGRNWKKNNMIITTHCKHQTQNNPNISEISFQIHTENNHQVASYSDILRKPHQQNRIKVSIFSWIRKKKSPTKKKEKKQKKKPFKGVLVENFQEGMESVALNCRVKSRGRIFTNLWGGKERERNKERWVWLKWKLRKGVVCLKTNFASACQVQTLRVKKGIIMCKRSYSRFL